MVSLSMATMPGSSPGARSPDQRSQLAQRLRSAGWENMANPGSGKSKKIFETTESTESTEKKSKLESLLSFYSVFSVVSVVNIRV